MHIARAVSAAACLAYLAAWGTAFAQGKPEDGLAVGRQMLAEDNPGELWIERGRQLFYERRGPKNASLEQCDFGMGPGKLEGAFVQLPRYFADTGKVQDTESRLVTCMVEIQGLDRAAVVQNRFSTLDRNSEVEALATFVASKSNGMKMAVRLGNPQEREMYKAGEYIFHRRNGPTDFACATCHSENGKRVRLQDLPNMKDPKQIQAVISGWPAYLGSKSSVLTMQSRLYECVWQMRLPDLGFVSDMSIALTAYLNYQGNGAVIQVPGVRR